MQLQSQTTILYLKNHKLRLATIRYAMPKTQSAQTLRPAQTDKSHWAEFIQPCLFREILCVRVKMLFPTEFKRKHRLHSGWCVSPIIHSRFQFLHEISVKRSTRGIIDIASIRLENEVLQPFRLFVVDYKSICILAGNKRELWPISTTPHTFPSLN